MSAAVTTSGPASVAEVIAPQVNRPRSKIRSRCTRPVGDAGNSNLAADVGLQDIVVAIRRSNGLACGKFWLELLGQTREDWKVKYGSVFWAPGMPNSAEYRAGALMYPEVERYDTRSRLVLV